MTIECTILKRMGLRHALFRKVASCETFECLVSERSAWAAYNFIRFLD